MLVAFFFGGGVALEDVDESFFKSSIFYFKKTSLVFLWFILLSGQISAGQFFLRRCRRTCFIILKKIDWIRVCFLFFGFPTFVTKGSLALRRRNSLWKWNLMLRRPAGCEKKPVVVVVAVVVVVVVVVVVGCLWELLLGWFLTTRLVGCFTNVWFIDLRRWMCVALFSETISRKRDVVDGLRRLWSTLFVVHLFRVCSLRSNWVSLVFVVCFFFASGRHFFWFIFGLSLVGDWWIDDGVFAFLFFFLSFGRYVMCFYRVLMKWTVYFLLKIYFVESVYREIVSMEFAISFFVAIADRVRDFCLFFF